MNIFTAAQPRGCEVYLLDGAKKKMDVDGFTTVRDCLGKMCDLLSIPSRFRGHFSLFECRRQYLATEFQEPPAFVLRLLGYDEGLQQIQESWAYSEPSLGGSEQIRLYFQLRRLTPSLAKSREPVIMHMAYIQAVHEVTTGYRVVKAAHQATVLAATQLYTEIGPFNSHHHREGCLLRFLHAANGKSTNEVPQLLELLPFSLLVEALQHEKERRKKKNQVATAAILTPTAMYESDPEDSDSLHFDGSWSGLPGSYEQWERLVLSQYKSVSIKLSGSNGNRFQRSANTRVSAKSSFLQAVSVLPIRWSSNLASGIFVVRQTLMPEHARHLLLQVSPEGLLLGYPLIPLPYERGTTPSTQWLRLVSSRVVLAAPMQSVLRWGAAPGKSFYFEACVDVDCNSGCSGSHASSSLAGAGAGTSNAGGGTGTDEARVVELECVDGAPLADLLSVLQLAQSSAHANAHMQGGAGEQTVVAARGLNSSRLNRSLSANADPLNCSLLELPPSVSQRHVEIDSFEQLQELYFSPQIWPRQPRRDAPQEGREDADLIDFVPESDGEKDEAAGGAVAVAAAGVEAAGAASGVGGSGADAQAAPRTEAYDSALACVDDDYDACGRVMAPELRAGVGGWSSAGTLHGRAAEDMLAQQIEALQALADESAARLQAQRLQAMHATEAAAQTQSDSGSRSPSFGFSLFKSCRSSSAFSDAEAMQDSPVHQPSANPVDTELPYLQELVQRERRVLQSLRALMREMRLQQVRETRAASRQRQVLRQLQIEWSRQLDVKRSSKVEEPSKTASIFMRLGNAQLPGVPGVTSTKELEETVADTKAKAVGGAGGELRDQSRALGGVGALHLRQRHLEWRLSRNSSQCHPLSQNSLLSAVLQYLALPQLLVYAAVSSRWRNVLSGRELWNGLVQNPCSMPLLDAKEQMRGWVWKHLLRLRAGDSCLSHLGATPTPSLNQFLASYCDPLTYVELLKRAERMCSAKNDDDGSEPQYQSVAAPVLAAVRAGDTGGRGAGMGSSGGDGERDVRVARQLRVVEQRWALQARAAGGDAEASYSSYDATHKKIETDLPRSFLVNTGDSSNSKSRPGSAHVSPSSSPQVQAQAQQVYGQVPPLSPPYKLPQDAGAYLGSVAASEEKGQVAEGGEQGESASSSSSATSSSATGTSTTTTTTAAGAITVNTSGDASSHERPANLSPLDQQGNPLLSHFDEDGLVQMQRLGNVLNAYAQQHPEVGYCQGMNFVAAMLLRRLGDEWQAYAAFVCLMQCDSLRLNRTFYDGFPQLQLRLFQHQQLLCQHLPRLAEKFDNEGIQAQMYASNWYMTVFASLKVLPLNCVERIWDVFLVQGWEVVFRVVLALLKRMESTLLHDLNDFTMTMSLLHHIPTKELPADTLMEEGKQFSVTRVSLLILEQQFLTHDTK